MLVLVDGSKVVLVLVDDSNVLFVFVVGDGEAEYSTSLEVTV
jgi:hypothetical protein